MNNCIFTLEPYKGPNTRHHCPICKSKDRSFSLYIYTATGEHVHPSVGRCNHESRCSHNYTPKQYFQDNKISFDMTTPYRFRQIPPKLAASFIDAELFKSSLPGYQDNNFVTFLIALFGEEVAGQLIANYFIGTSKHWPGSTVFWQIDSKGKIRTGKVMLYNAITGHRIKEPISLITWVQSVLKLPDFNMTQCLFGEHLLTNKTRPVAIVESEKTAIIASVYLPQFVWLATGGLSNLNTEKFRVLAGRTVVLFPDVNGYDRWTDKAKELGERIPKIRFEVSDLLERLANDQERKDGLDIADYLIKFDWKQFRNNPLPLAAADIEVNPKSKIGENDAPPKNIIVFSNPVQVVEIAQEEAINWYNGNLLPSMNKSDICNTLHF